MKILSGKRTILKDQPDILYDESRLTIGTPEKIYYPECTVDIISILEDSHKKSKTITIIGGQTGLTGGSVPMEDCYVISFNSMQRILRVEMSKNNIPILYCQPGVLLIEIADFLKSPEKYKYPVNGHKCLTENRWFYPPDPTEMSAQLGGTVATNASGARSYRFGPTRDHIESLTLVFASGETATLRRDKNHFHNGTCTITTDQANRITIPELNYTSPHIKNASGYFSRKNMDAIDLFIGSEGTLAVIAEVGIRLSPLPVFAGGLSFFPSRNDAFRFADLLRKEERVISIEYFDSTALDFLTQGKNELPFNLPNFPDNARTALYWEYVDKGDITFVKSMDIYGKLLNQCHSSLRKTWSGIEPKEIEKLKQFRHAVPELINLRIAQYKRTFQNIRKISTDAAVSGPVFKDTFTTFTDLISKKGLETIIFGHLGDYHLHFNILPHSNDELEKGAQLYNELMEFIISKGGTVSAEHGIGKIKVDYFEKMMAPEGIDEMMKIKMILDPEDILNRGNLFKYK